MTLSDCAAECREVRCAAAGGDRCAFAIKLKAKGSPALDWSALEGEWKALDK